LSSAVGLFLQLSNTIISLKQLIRHKRKEKIMEAQNGAYVLTETGKEIVAAFIAECVAKRKEILDAGKDTAEETNLPSEEVILSDLNFGVGVDEDGDYYNGWGVTDHYNADTILGLSLGKDFVEVLDASAEKKGALL